MTSKRKIALVTGASRGIGQAIAKALGEDGMYIIGTATTQMGATHINQQFDADNIQGHGEILNLYDLTSIQSLLSRMKEADQMPDILINNAGLTKDNLVLRMKDEEWLEILQSNLTGCFRLIQGCLKSMIQNRWGRIINMGSVVGLTGNAGQANYAAAKAGLIGMSKSIAREVGSRNITVNVIAPGYIETDMTNKLSDEMRAKITENIPLKRVGQKEEVAYAVQFLASPMAGYITGETLNINGGMFMC